MSGTVGANQLKPFPSPVPPWSDAFGPVIVRANDNAIASAFNAHDSDATIHLSRTTTAGVTTSAVTIYPAITAGAWALVSGDDGTNGFIDAVAWYLGGSAVSFPVSWITRGTAASRTYTIAAGALQLKMGSGTYTIQVVPVTF